MSAIFVYIYGAMSMYVSVCVIQGPVLPPFAKKSFDDSAWAVVDAPHDMLISGYVSVCECECECVRMCVRVRVRV